ncbi:MAG: hemolysin III family protein [Bacilli bacterium]|nr:hemolysin III family protein [Bacilli bacterium]
MQENDLEQKSYRDLKKEYRDLRAKYVADRFAVQDAKKAELERLHDDYKIAKLEIEEPLKAEKYRIRVEKKYQHRLLNEAPKRRTLEEIGNAVSHGIGALIGILFLVLFVLKSHDALSLTAAIIYGTCFFLQMLFSCLYHSFRAGTKVKRLFRRFDYSSIYLEIGGTFAPLYLIYMVNKMWGFGWGIGFFAVQWAIIAMGITFVAVFGPGRVRWLHFVLYFVVGWSAIMFIPYWVQQDLPLFFWILGGGVVYTLGMIPFAALKKKPVAHFIWHIVVLLAAVCMATGIYLYVF